VKCFIKRKESEVIKMRRKTDKFFSLRPFLASQAAEPSGGVFDKNRKRIFSLRSLRLNSKI
jgi:hypothetical protein